MDATTGRRVVNKTDRSAANVVQSNATDSYLGQGGKKYSLENNQLTVPDLSPNPIGSFSDDADKFGSIVFLTASGRRSGNITFNSDSKTFSVYNHDTSTSIGPSDGINITDLEVAKKYFISTITHKDSPNGGPLSNLFLSRSVDSMVDSIASSFSLDTPDSDFDNASKLAKDVNNSRLAYLGSPTDANKDVYKKALKDLIDLQYSVNPSSAKTTKFTDSRLSARDVAEINLHIQKQVKDAPDTPTVESVDAEYVKLAGRATDFDTKFSTHPTVRELSKDGTYQSLFDQIDSQQRARANEYVARGYDLSVASVLAKTRIIELYNKKLSDGNQVAIEFKSSTDNAVILYLDKDFNPVASPEDVVRLRSALALVNRSGLATKIPSKFTLINSNSRAPGITNAGPDAQAYSSAGRGVFLLVDRMNNSVGDISGKPGWFSTDTKDIDAVFNHIVAHETGHIIQYSEWGSNTPENNGLEALETDFNSRGMSTDDAPSEYAKDSFAEYFAETYARYLLTGEASDAFKELLSDKGLLRRDPSKWESSLTEQELELYGIYQKFENYSGVPTSDPNLSSMQRQALIAKRNQINTYEMISLFGNISDGASWISKDEIDPNRVLFFRGTSPTGQLDTRKMQENFVNESEPWVGTGVFGNGWYTSTAWSEATTYSSVGSSINSMNDAISHPEFWLIQAKPSAKIVSANDVDFQNKITSFRRRFLDFTIKTFMERDGDQPDEARAKAQAIYDRSPLAGDIDQTEYAVMFGYDGIALEKPIATDPASQLRTKMVIMNRSAFNIVDKRVN